MEKQILTIDGFDGHVYTVEVAVRYHDIGERTAKILRTACKGRWPLLPVAYTDEWLREQLQSRVNRMFSN